ncbi:hypothetical protein FGO68_gene11095 [Halteria grandinella]|uniref:Uncharacterized protein n=1 Tax=Halteria grandinella TaxID=5974 RepID=A0A8J8SYD0_HALGN|nr:hypothetical protein FGO68_gene11095 [Halteria grandinella]
MSTIFLLVLCQKCPYLMYTMETHINAQSPCARSASIISPNSQISLRKKKAIYTQARKILKIRESTYEQKTRGLLDRP